MPLFWVSKIWPAYLSLFVQRSSAPMATTDEHQPAFSRCWPMCIFSCLGKWLEWPESRKTRRNSRVERNIFNPLLSTTYIYGFPGWNETQTCLPYTSALTVNSFLRYRANQAAFQLSGNCNYPVRKDAWNIAHKIWKDFDSLIRNIAVERCLEWHVTHLFFVLLWF